MAVIRNRAAEADLTFRVGSLGETVLRVVEFNGTEGISQLFHFTLELASADAEVDFKAVVGQPAGLTVEGAPESRHVNGIICRFEQAGRGPDYTRYRGELVPAMWLLTQRQNCRIFQGKSVPDIVKEVLQDARLPSDSFRFALRGSYAPRDFCCQYRESDMDFIARLLEEEGICYFFEHSEDKHILVMGDNAGAHPPIEPPATVALRAVGYGSTDEEFFSTFTLTQAIRPGTVVLRDFNATKPSLDLTVQEQGRDHAELEVYDYPGEYLDKGTGSSLAKVRLEEEQAAAEQAAARSDCRRLTAGYTFVLDGHERTEFNKEYLITTVHHYGSQPQALDVEAAAVSPQPVYENDIECIPKATPFRPPRLTPRPLISGSQTAIVTGPGGEEVHTDEQGRVKVHFHWDRLGTRDDKSSCWVRVSQGWAGVGYGIMFLPRIGQEVIVDFLEGDPDRPIITGRVYNGEQVPPYSLPADKTKSTIKTNSSKGGGGSNEIRFEDKKGGEELYIHAQKDHMNVTQNDRSEDVGHDRSLHVGNDKSEAIDNNKSIQVGVDHSETIGANKTLSVGANHDETIGANMGLTVGSNKTENVGINTAETIGAAKELTIGAAYQVSVGAAMNETIGAAKAEEIGAAKSVNVGANSSENVAADKSIDAGGNISESAAKDVSISSGKKMSLTAGDDYAVKGGKKGVIEIADELTIKCGKATINLKKNGDITINGKKIQAKASGDIVMKGKKILQN